MWTTLALAVAFGTGMGQSESLTLTNVRATYGELGPVRPDNKVLPGDAYIVAFDVEGLKVADDGRVTYSMGMEILDTKGKQIYAHEPRNLEAICFLGGGRMSMSTFFKPGFTKPPGEYTMKVTVKDQKANTAATFSRTFEVLKKDFGLISPYVSYDFDGRFLASPVGVPGQTLVINFYAVGFERDKTKMQPNVKLEMRVLDENGKATAVKPWSALVDSDVGSDIVLLPMRYMLVLNRPGKFTIELTGTDKVAEKTAKISYPITVLEQKAPAATEQK